MTGVHAPRSMGCDRAGIPDKHLIVMLVLWSRFCGCVEGCAVCRNEQGASTPVIG